MDANLKERVDGSLVSLRTGLAADGSDLQVTGCDDDGIEVSLVLTAESCTDCIVSTDLMETMIKNIVGQVAPDIPVTYVDPRTDATSA